MRPLQLHLVNFGPYRDQVVDFEDFNEVPLFLISGKTGSGKTTIFDAMCFALFGQSSGGDRDPEAMRSDFAADSEPTAVTLIFEHQHQQYVITRSPKQTVAKKRGTGTTIQNASVDLTVTDHNGKEQSWTKKNTVEAKLYDLLHLTPAQFTQIVLLPQGQFRQFLAANSNEKQALLADLFGTDLYARWANQLNDRLREMKQAASEQSTKLTTMTQMIEWVTESAPAKDAPVQDVLTVLTRQIEQMTPALQQRKAALELSQSQLAKTVATLKAAESLQTLMTARERASQHQASLAKQAPMMADLANRIAQIDWATTVVPLQNKRRETAQLVEQTRQRLATTNADLTASTTKLTEATAKLAEMKARQGEEQTRQQELTQLASVRPLYEQVRSLSDQVKTQQVLTEATTTAVAKRQRQLTEAQQQVTRLSQMLNQLNEQSNELTTVQAKRQQVTMWQQQWATLEQHQQAVSAQQQHLDELRQRLAHAKQVQTGAEKAYQNADHAWTVTQIKRLSAKLVPGEPCPVCGATDHPKVAVLTETAITEAEVKQAEQQRQVALSAVASLTAELETQTDHWQQAQAELQTTTQRWLADVAANQTVSSPMTVDQVVAWLKQQLDQLTQVQTQLSQALAEKGSTETTLASEKQLVEQLQSALTELQEKAQTQAQQLVRLQAQLGDRKQSLPERFADLTALDRHMTQLEAASAAFLKDQQALQAAQNSAQQAVTRLQANHDSLTMDLNSQENEQTIAITTFKQALVSEDEKMTEIKFAALAEEISTLGTLKQQYQAYLDEQTSVKSQLVTLAQQIGDQSLPDLAQLTETQRRQTEQRDEAQQAYYEYEQVVKQNQQVADKITQTLAEHQAAQQQLVDMTQLANTANGKGDLKLSLERYILQTYLQKVLQVANGRLGRLTGGRYQFRLDPNAGSHATDTGLEIDVFDDQAGKVRSVHTLSGGESFIAALSLALALGEVIQRESGGIAMEALFVDEGFGSLDEEALQMAMEALQSIEGQNRMIGIISHVTELQEQIPDQLKVIALANGQSRIEYQHEL